MLSRWLLLWIAVGALVAVACGSATIETPDGARDEGVPAPGVGAGPDGDAARTDSGLGDGGGDALPTMLLGTVAPDGGGYIPLTDGEDVTLVQGAQGGFHVWMKFRLYHVPPATVQLFETIHRVSDGAAVLNANAVIDLGGDGPGGYFELPNPVFMFTCPSPVGVRVQGQLLDYEMTIVGARGTLAHAAVQLVPGCPASAEALCMQLCDG